MTQRDSSHDSIQPRPLIPDACFKTSIKWRQICQAIVNAFGRGLVQWGDCKTTVSVKSADGKKKAQYKPDPHRYVDILCFSSPEYINSNNHIVNSFCVYSLYSFKYQLTKVAVILFAHYSKHSRRSQGPRSISRCIGF